MAGAGRRIGRILLFGTLPILVMSLLAACLAALALFFLLLLLAALPVGTVLVAAATRHPVRLAPPA
ncbi:MAG TPA: hypothetical protein VGP33_09105, partial [Chloroflexota bacterium]|nr:hypothetical protein [Chloroflexota bacterium]